MIVANRQQPGKRHRQCRQYRWTDRHAGDPLGLVPAHTYLRLTTWVRRKTTEGQRYYILDKYETRGRQYQQKRR